MPSSKEQLDYVLDQLSLLEGVRFKPMMGEYVLYFEDRVFGGVYDDRFLLKSTKASEAAFPDSPREIPYPGAKPMVSADCGDGLEERKRLKAVVEAMVAELPAPKPPRKRG
ncbi:MAG: TfoX/Sxy family protein [Fibrobacterales bacterium]|nr:TfoX/Sxy family protein [Fibrobacterales bacterium]